MEKKGVTNIEFILSFMLFIGFTFGAIYFFNPANNTSTEESSLAYVFNEIIKNTSTIVESYSIKIDMEKPISIDLGIDLSGRNVMAEDYYGGKLPAGKLDNPPRILLDASGVSSSGKDFAIIKISPDFEGEDFPLSTELCNYPECQIASFISEELISEKKFKNMAGYYDLNYESLKRSINIPPNLDFSMEIEFRSGDKIAPQKAGSTGGEIFSETKIREILKEDGSTEYAYVTVKIW